MSETLEGTVALITGASSGIGRATALALARAGAAVSLVARRRERLESLAREIEAAGSHALPTPADVSKRQEVETAVAATVRELGRLDVLVNNAGIMPLSPLEECRIDEWEAMVDVNVKGVLYGIGAALPVMIEQGRGHIVNVGSVAGRRPFPGGTVYSATKFAVRALSAGIHKELSASKKIRVTDIEPGVVDTELADGIRDEATREGFAERWRGKRMLESHDVARAILYAVSAPDRVNVNEVLVRPTDQDT